MKVYAKFKIVSISEEQTKTIQRKQVPMCYVIANEGDSYLSLTVWGDQKIQICKEKMESGTLMECVLSITGKVVESDEGGKRYYNNFNILTIL